MHRASRPDQRGGRYLRNIAAAALIVGLFAGTCVWQSDDTWPLAQMRMFPGGGESAVAIVAIRADLINGDQRDMNPFAFHLKRTDIEGQMNRILDDPAMLGDLIETYNATVPRPREIERLSLVRRESAGHRNGKPVWNERELVSWPT